MRSNRALIGIIIAICAFLNPLSASALDIPLLTWERGKEQNLVLGGNTDNEWKIELLNEANEPVLEFSASDISANGFVVYSVFIPRDFPLGAYAVRATGLGVPATIVAGVNVVSLTFYELVQIPFELLWIFLAYIFVTVAYSTARIRSFARVLLQRFPEDDFDRIPPLLVTLYRLRVSASANLDPSLLQIAIQREGEWLRHRSLSLWSTFPLLAFFAGGWIGIEILRSGGLGNAPWILLFLAAILTVVDLYSGMIAFAGLVLSHLIFGDVVSLRDVMALLAVALGSAGAYALGTILILLDEGRENERSTRIVEAKVRGSILGLTLGGLVTAALFHAAQILILSLVVTVSNPAPLSWVLSLALGIAVVARSLLRNMLESRERSIAGNGGVIEIAVGRLVAPKTVVFLAIFFIGTLYIWIREWVPAVALGLALAAPLSMLTVRFRGPRLRALLRVPRSPLVEAIVVTTVGFLIFNATEDLPFEVLDRSRLFLVLGVIPVLIHSFYSMVWDVTERNPESEPRVEEGENI